MSLWNDPRT